MRKELISVNQLGIFLQELEAGLLTPAQVAQQVAGILTQVLADYSTTTDMTQAIAALASTSLKREIVDALPTPGAADDNVIYMVSAGDGAAGDYYDEYLFISGTAEKIGSTRVDLRNVLTEDDLASDADILALFE